MGEQNTFAIVIEMLARGDGAKVTRQQVEELVRAEKAAAESDQRKAVNIRNVIDAVKQLNPELTKQAGETKKVETAQKDETVQTEKGTNAKKDYREAVKGLALEFPILARVMGMMANPLTGVVAVLGTVIGLVKQYADSVHAAGVASQELAKAAVSARDLASAHAEVATATANFEKEFAKISTDAASASKNLAEYLGLLQLKQQLEQQLDDAQLGAELERIEGDPKLTPAGKIQETNKATQEAARRKRNREDAAMQESADAQSLEAHYAGQRAQQLKDQAAALAPAIAQANTQATAAATEAKGFSNAKEQTEVAAMLETVRGLREAAKGGASGVAAYNLLHPFRTEQLKAEFPPQPIGDIEEQLINRKADLERQAEQVENTKKDKAAKANELAKEKARLEAEAAKEETDRAANQAGADKLYKEIGTRREYRKRTEPILEGTESSKAGRAVKKVNDQFWQEYDQMDQEWDDYESGRTRHAPNFSVPSTRGNRSGDLNFNAPANSQFQQLISATQGMGEDTIQALSKATTLLAQQSNSIRALSQEIERLTGQNKNDRNFA